MEDEWSFFGVAENLIRYCKKTEGDTMRTMDGQQDAQKCLPFSAQSFR